jgi:hypothetical protein
MSFQYLFLNKPSLNSDSGFDHIYFQKTTFKLLDHVKATALFAQCSTYSHTLWKTQHNIRQHKETINRHEAHRSGNKDSAFVQVQFSTVQEGIVNRRP